MQSVVNFHKQLGFKQIVFFFSDQAEAEKKANASQRREDSVPTTAAETIKPGTGGTESKPQQLFKCTECPKSFTIQVNLRRHFRLKHERNQVRRQRWKN